MDPQPDTQRTWYFRAEPHYLGSEEFYRVILRHENGAILRIEALEYFPTRSLADAWLTALPANPT